MRSSVSGIQIPTAARLNIDGEFTLDATAGTSGQVLISQGAGNTPIWTSTPNLNNPLLTRVDSTSEGGQINFARSSDGAQYWYIDSFGGTSTPDLRFIENATERFKIASGGVLYINGSAGTSGQVLTSSGTGSAPTWTTVSGSSFTGGTLTSNLTLAAGTTSLSPLTFQSGTNLTSVTSGAQEYDGTVFYQTSNTNPGRALATQQYYYASSADYGPDFTISGAVKSMLGGATTGISVAAGTTYEYEFYTTVQHQYITNTGVTGTYAITSSTVSGSPTVAVTHQVDYGSNTTNFTTATTLSTVRTTGSVTFSATISSGSRYNFLRAKGIIRVTGTGVAKIYPGLSTSQVGASDNTWTVQAGTVFKLTPIGNGTATTIGTWA